MVIVSNNNSLEAASRKNSIRVWGFIMITQEVIFRELSRTRWQLLCIIDFSPYILTILAFTNTHQSSTQQRTNQQQQHAHRASQPHFYSRITNNSHPISPLSSYTHLASQHSSPASLLLTPSININFSFRCSSLCLYRLSPELKLIPHSLHQYLFISFSFESISLQSVACSSRCCDFLGFVSQFSVTATTALVYYEAKRFLLASPLLSRGSFGN